MTNLELRELMAKEVHDARQIQNRADAEKRPMTAEERLQTGEMFARVDELEARIETEERKLRVEAAESRLATSTRQTRPASIARFDEAADSSEALRSWFSRGVAGMRVDGAALDNALRTGLDITSPEIELRRPKLSRKEMRTMSKANDAGVVAWTEFFAGFYEELKSFGPVLDLISYHNSDNGNNLPIPVLDDTANAAVILAEEATAAAADVSVANVVLGAYKYSSNEVIMSLELLQDSSVDIESYVAKALAARFARAWAAHVTTGTGSGQPYGLVTRSTASGVVAGGTGAAPTLTGDNFIDLAESLDDAYKSGNKVGYMMSPATMTKVRKLKDNNGQYLWNVSLQQGLPATFYGYPVYRNQAMASTGVNAKLAVFGDFSKYLWRNVSPVQIFKLNEFRIRSAQISYIGFARGDGNLIQPNAVKSLAAPAS